MTKVTLRQKTISEGRKSLYLDIYPPIKSETTGKLHRKFYLKLFIYNRPKSEAEKLHNKETLLLAEYLRAQRQIDIQNDQYDFFPKIKLNSNFIEFFQTEADKRPESKNWDMAVNYFKKFAGYAFPFKNLDETICDEYKNYLLSSPAIGRSRKKLIEILLLVIFQNSELPLKRHIGMDIC